MLDFMLVTGKPSSKKGLVEIYPLFIVQSSSDLMTRGNDFYAVWDEDNNLWSTDENVLINLVDKEVNQFTDKVFDYISQFNDHTILFDDIPDKYKGIVEMVLANGGTRKCVRILHMRNGDSGMIDKFHKYVQKQMRQSFSPLDKRLIFANEMITKEDYVSHRLSYPLQEGDISAYDEIIGTLYSEEERKKIEWAIGAIVSGDSKDIQKFVVMYGPPGSGKSTILNIIQDLFDGYYCAFDAKNLGSGNSEFALEPFKMNPLIAIQHDGDLSHIEDNTRLNSVVSHETLVVNEKHKNLYSQKFNSFLFLGTNRPVRITDSKSGIIRRLIDVSPSGKKIPLSRYKDLMEKVKFELGGIAYHCLQVYLNDKNAYETYVPKSMLGATNTFYNYILNYYDQFKTDDSVTLKRAWEMYKTYCEDAEIKCMPKHIFGEELKTYFKNYEERATLEDGTRTWNYYSGFIFDKYAQPPDVKKEEPKPKMLELNCTESLFDIYCADCYAQEANEEGTPNFKWDNCTTKLKDICTSNLHFVRLPENHIVIDLDLKDSEGHKCFNLNAVEATKWPPTYAEVSKSGEAIHLHYIYDGDPKQLKRIYDQNIEIKVFTGNSSLRRKLTKCNDIPIATISSGLPLKEDNKVINYEGLKNTEQLYNFIKKAVNKGYEPYSTKSNIDYIWMKLDEAYKSGMVYDATPFKPAILSFAAASSNNPDYCIKRALSMKFKSETEPEDNKEEESINGNSGVFAHYDLEVYPNLLYVAYKTFGEDKPVVGMFNPSPSDIENLIKNKLIGFNNRRYDNHILYGRLLGYNNQEIYELSQRLIGKGEGFFGEAYNLSYTDIYDYCAKKQSLKKWEIELGIHHQEFSLPWDQPVPEDKWEMVADYCKNDVLATEAVWNATQGDFTARKILAALAGMTVNDTTNSLTTRIIFGKERHPALVYTDLSETFPGYEYIPREKSTDFKAHNMYRGVDLGFGGYVYAEPGMYGNVALLDVASLHPHSIIAMNCFGEYTARFKDILDARILIKHKDFDAARKMLNGALAPYLDDESQAKDLAQALKIAINSVYGLTSASFDNPFRDPRNVNNIVALRGALFMKTLQDEVQAKGYTVAHIKTDSIKIPDADPDIIQFCMDFANKYGYTFEHEDTYDRICLVNDAVYIAKYKQPHKDKKTGEEIWWTATGTQFQVPYVFKRLFTKQKIDFYDLCETKSVTSALYLDMNEGLPESEHQYHFVGKVGQFCPIKPGCGGGILYREKDGKYSAATGSKGYRWLESESVKLMGKENDVDESYYENLASAAVDEISKHGDYEWFVSDEPYIPTPFKGGKIIGES